LIVEAYGIEDGDEIDYWLKRIIPNEVDTQNEDIIQCVLSETFR
jgi:hypothetical protein